MTLRKKIEIPAKLKKDPKAVLTKKQPAVYTTFRLSQKAHDAIKEQARRFGCKNDEIFNYLSATLAIKALVKENFISLVPEVNIDTTRKTYVVRKDTLHCLEELAKNQKMSRDNLIEQGVLDMKASLDSSESARKEKYQKTFDTRLNPFWEQVCDINEKLHEELGGDDPICSEFRLIVSAVDGFMQNIEAYLTKGTPINPDAL